MKVHKNYYKMSFGNFIGVAVNEKTMKKIAKIQAKTYHEIMSVIENAEDIHIPHWSITKEPKELDQDERTFYYFNEQTALGYARGNLKEMFGIQKIENLYQVEGMYSESRERAEKEHQEYLKSTEEVTE